MQRKKNSWQCKFLKKELEILMEIRFVKWNIIKGCNEKEKRKLRRWKVYQITIKISYTTTCWLVFYCLTWKLISSAPITPLTLSIINANPCCAIHSNTIGNYTEIKKWKCDTEYTHINTIIIHHRNVHCHKLCIFDALCEC